MVTPLSAQGDNNPTIFPLSSDSSLDPKTAISLKAYFKFLNAAFNTPRIHNLAITGGFGVGKSSIIRSFERDLHKHKKDPKKHFVSRIREKVFPKRKTDMTRFLYISLGKYPSFEPSIQEDNKTVKTKGEKESEKSCKEINAIERRLLLQIYARFKKKDLPSSSYKLVREKIGQQFFKSVICAIFTCAVLLLTFHKSLGELIVYSFPCIADIGSVLHLILYLLTIGVASFTVGLVCYWLMPRLHLTNLSLKTNNAEIALEKKACESYLDQYSLELVYCLEQIANKIDRTVVFEDLDRLNSETCIQILTRLREINYLINLRLDETKYIRFVYVVNDDIISCIEHSKFFDYVLPIVPGLNKRSSEAILRDNLKKINNALKKKENEQCNLFKRIEQIDSEGIVHQVAPYLVDFRLQYTILNEYELIFHLFQINNQNEIRDDDAEHLFALAIYKNIWPEDYSKIKTGNSEVFPTCNIKDKNSWHHSDLLKILTNPQYPMLTPRCLYYIGYSEQDIAKERNNILRDIAVDNSVKIAVINSIESGDFKSIKGVCNYCGTLKYERKSDNNIKIFITAIRCMIRCNNENNDWFFNRDIVDCLEILKHIEDDTIKKFFDLSGFDKKIDIYEHCANRNNLENTRNWAERELYVFCLGVKEFNDNVSITIETDDGNLYTVNLSDKVYEMWKSN